MKFKCSVNVALQNGMVKTDILSIHVLQNKFIRERAKHHIVLIILGKGQSFYIVVAVVESVGVGRKMRWHKYVKILKTLKIL